MKKMSFLQYLLIALGIAICPFFISLILYYYYQIQSFNDILGHIKNNVNYEESFNFYFSTSLSCTYNLIVTIIVFICLLLFISLTIYFLFKKKKLIKINAYITFFITAMCYLLSLYLSEITYSILGIRNAIALIVSLTILIIVFSIVMIYLIIRERKHLEIQITDMSSNPTSES